MFPEFTLQNIVASTLKNMWTMLPWQFWAFMAFVLVLKIVDVVFPDIIDVWRTRSRMRAGMKWTGDRELLLQLRGMSPKEFENYISDLFRKLGYRAEAVGKSHDGGIDVIAEKDGAKIYIQCKKFITSQVRVGDVRDFYGALVDHLANAQGYFITTNKFTLEAKQFAEDKPLELIDGFALIKYIRMAEKDNKPNKRAITKAEKPCPKCGGSLVEKNGKYGKFYGCSNYPKCKFTEAINAA